MPEKKHMKFKKGVNFVQKQIIVYFSSPDKFFCAICGMTGKYNILVYHPNNQEKEIANTLNTFTNQSKKRHFQFFLYNAGKNREPESGLCSKQLSTNFISVF